MKIASRIVVLVLVFNLLLCRTFAADKKQLAAALAMVDENLKTAAGKKYDESAGAEFSLKFIPNVRQCKQSAPVGSNLSSFDMLLRLDEQGKVQEVLVDPETALSLCTRTALLRGSFSPPPHGTYWINIHMQIKH